MINYFTVTNKNKENLTCAYCENRNEPYIMYTYDIKIISRRNDCKYFITSSNFRMCNMCYENIHKDSGRILEISNNFYNRFVSKNEQYLKTPFFLKGLYSVQSKRVLSVFSELYMIGETRFETRAVCTHGFYVIDEYSSNEDRISFSSNGSRYGGVLRSETTQNRYYTPPSFTTTTLASTPGGIEPAYATGYAVRADSINTDNRATPVVDVAPAEVVPTLISPGVSTRESDVSFTPPPADERAVILNRQVADAFRRARQARTDAAIEYHRQRNEQTNNTPIQPLTGDDSIDAVLDDLDLL